MADIDFLNLNNLIKKIKQEIDGIDKQILIDFPVVDYQEIVESMPLSLKYQFVPQELQKISTKIRSQYGSEAISIYHRLVLCLFIEKSLTFLHDGRNFPERVVQYYTRHFEYLLEHILDNLHDDIHSYDFESDVFLKDLSLCSLRMFPVGAHVIELVTAPKKFVICGGIDQFFEAASLYLRVLRRSPFYNIHLDSRWLKNFNRIGWCECYQVIAEMLKKNPEVGGVCGGSWFFDPQLEKISPGLLYLRKIPEQGGAKLFKAGKSPQDIKNAVVKSARRQKLYKEDKYVPINYTIIWLRDDLIRWAENQSESFTYSFSCTQ